MDPTPTPSDSLTAQLRSLHSGMAHLATFLTALCGIQATLLLAGRLAALGPAAAYAQGLCGMALAVVAVAWSLAQRQIGRWMERADALLGPGVGRALLRLGRLPQNQPVLIRGERAVVDLVELASTYPEAGWLDDPAMGSWAAATVLGAGAWLSPVLLPSLVQVLAALFTAWGAWRLGQSRKIA